MSDETTNVETPEAEQPPITINFAGYPKPLVLVPSKPRKKKNSEDFVNNYLPKLEGKEIFEFLQTVIPAEKLVLALFNELIKPAAGEATQKALVDNPATGEPTFDEDAYASVFIEQFNPASRRYSGPTKKDLEDRIRQLGQELLEATVALQNDPADGAARNRLHNVVVEMSEVNTKLEAKRRGPQAKRKSKKAEAAAA